MTEALPLSPSAIAEWILFAKVAGFYLAAGFLRLPLPRFLLVTGAASCVWTLAILFLAQTFGERLTNWLGTYKHAGLLLLGMGVLLLASLQLLRRAFVNFNFRRFTAR